MHLKAITFHLLISSYCQYPYQQLETPTKQDNLDRNLFLPDRNPVLSAKTAEKYAKYLADYSLAWSILAASAFLHPLFAILWMTEAKSISAGSGLSPIPTPDAMPVRAPRGRPPNLN